jgi:hypothetical protein
MRLPWFLLLLVFQFNGSVFGENWPRFRGVNGGGISNAKTVPVKWSDGDYNWKLELAGSGLSSPVVWENRLFVTSADAEAGERYLYCVNTSDGSIAWKNGFPFTHHKKHKNNSFAANTPAVDAGHVYVVWQSNKQANLSALTHSGKPVWTYDLGPFKGGHGPAGSPIVFDDLVVFCNDHEGPSFLVGVDRMTGQARWKVERTGKRACYTTPCIFRGADGESQLIFTHSYQGITSVNPRTGKENWAIAPFGTFKQRAIGSPIVAGDLVIGSSGFTTAERNVVVVRPPAGGASTGVTEVFRVTKHAPHIPTPLAYDGLMFLWDDRGIVACTELDSGKTVWVKRVGGTYYGSPICVDGKLYCADRNGNVVVIAASREYELLARNPLGEPTCATPAVAGGVLYLRSDAHLFSIGG